MAMGWRSPFQFWNKRDIAIDGEIVEYCAREFVPRPIGVRSSGGDLLGLVTGEIRGAGIEECANGACRRKKFDVAKQRQLRNGGSSTQALEWGVEANLDSQCRLRTEDRKSTRLNSSHLVISYAVFCLKKKKKKIKRQRHTNEKQ